MPETELAAELAEIARELATSQVDIWASVLTDFASVGSEVESALTRSTPSAPTTTARRLRQVWQRHGPELPGVALALALRAAGHVHRDTDSRRASLVVSGPTDFHAPTRLTRPAALEVVASARDRVLLVSYVTHGMAELIEELQRAAIRGVGIDFVLEGKWKQGGTVSGGRTGETVFAPLRGHARFWRWPAQNRKELNALTVQKSRPALHAKIIVADARCALLSSANLTDRAYSRNLEVGVLLRDPDLVGRLDGHFRRLIDSKTLEECPEQTE
ncbi:DISARM system phospholipase D-like protein DrmC [Crossiella sp. NPDC003009]